MKVARLLPNCLVGGSFPTYAAAVRRLGQAIIEKLEKHVFDIGDALLVNGRW